MTMKTIWIILLYLVGFNTVDSQCVDEKKKFAIATHKKKRRKDCRWAGKKPNSRCGLKVQSNNRIYVRDKCRKSCNNCSIAKRSAGEACSHDSQCSGVCRRGTCLNSKHCEVLDEYPLSGEDEPFNKETVVLIFVGSGFKKQSDLRNQITKTYSAFSNAPYFNDPKLKLRSLFVTKPETSFCNYGCQGIDRLLCCTLQKTLSLSKKCFPTRSTVQTIVVHNDDKYGGAGYAEKNIAVTSTNSLGPALAMHELGHSLFELGDEYGYGAATATNSANCDTAGCPKWSDLGESLNLNLCRVKGCKGSNYFIGRDSFMRSMQYDIGHVNQRYMCCTYLALTKKIPEFCEFYDQHSKGGLLEYCQQDHQGYGGPQAYLPAPKDIGLNIHGVQIEGPPTEHVWEITKESKFALTGRPVVLHIYAESQTFSYADDNDHYTLGEDKATEMFPVRMVRGDYEDMPTARQLAESNFVNEVTKVRIHFDSKLTMRFIFSKRYRLEIPPFDFLNETISDPIDEEDRAIDEASVIPLVFDGSMGRITNVTITNVQI